jgi:hypothetical protein
MDHCRCGIAYYGHEFGGMPTNPEVVFEAAREAARFGFREVIVDANFSADVVDPEAWLEVPKVLAPAIELAHG